MLDFESAADWIDANQLGRRNLSQDAFKLLLGRRYNRVKKATKDGEKGTAKTTVGQSDPRLRESTAAKLAAQHGVSEKTVKRSGSASPMQSDYPLTILGISM